MEFKDQRVIVTGGAKGIGKGISEAFAKEGAHVYVLDIDVEKGKELVQDLNKNGYSSEFHCIDVTDEAEVKEFFSNLPSVDVLCSNCGVYPQKMIRDMEKKDWEKVQEINVTGAFLMTKYALEKMIPKGYGRIVITSSITGPITGYPGWSHYGASKAALLGFMRSACLECAKDGVTINAVMPGNIITDGLIAQGEEYAKNMAKSVPVGFLGSIEDIANSVLFFASPKNRYITGQTLIIDGGQILPECESAIL